MRDDLFIIDESTVLSTVGQQTFYSVVVDGSMPLKVTMVYADPAGTPNGNGARVNNLGLRIVSPTGQTYHGNAGLTTSNWSSTQKIADSKNTVENVFIQNPAVGTWQLIVTLHELNADGRLEPPICTPPDTSCWDADFALVASGIVPAISCSRSPDWDHDGKITPGDLFGFVDDFLAGRADVDRDRETSMSDVQMFLQRYVEQSSQK